MRVGHVQPSRANYYDRTPTSQAKSYKADNVAPHADVARWTYTVPSGKKAFLEGFMARLIRTVVAAPIGQWRVEFLMTPNGGGTIYFQSLTMVTNVVGDRDELAVGALGSLLPGDVLQANTSDNSTGGTVSYIIAAKIVEYDA